MIPKRHARYYAYVWPLFWPWLWLQLWRLERWQRETKRDLLIAVDRYGNIYVRAVADAPDKWRYTPPDVPAWEHPARHSDMPPAFLDLCPRLPVTEGRDCSCTPYTAEAPLYFHFDTS